MVGGKNRARKNDQQGDGDHGFHGYNIVPTLARHKSRAITFG
jgi:hypothetical protein